MKLLTDCRRMLAVLLVSIMLLSLLPIQAFALEIPDNGGDSEGYIVKLKDTAPAKLTEELETVSAEEGLYLADTERDIKDIPAAQIEYVEPNYSFTLLDTAADDELYTIGAQWDLADTNVPAAWSKGQYGAGVTVAVIDSGLYGVNPGESHEDIDASRIVKPYNFADDNTNLTDESGHGTFVAGQIFASTNNGAGVAGIMPAVKIMPLKVFSGTDTTASYVIRAIYYAIENGAQVINLSLGGPEKSLALEDACRDAVNAGVLVVAAAGNDGTSTPIYPAAFDCVVGVGAVTQENAHFYQSQYGESVYVVAPGNRVFGIKNSRDAYCFKSGTSMASPCVAALGAMAKSIDKSITQSSFMALLRQTSRDLGDTGYDSVFGFGLVDFGEAAGKLLGTKSHSYGAWKSDGLSTHTRACTDSGCSLAESALHSWDKGLSLGDNKIKYTCIDCGQTRTSDNSADREWEYELINNGTELKVTKYIGNKSVIVIPSELMVNGKSLPVTALGNKTFMQSDIFWLELPDTITHVDDGTSSVFGVTGTCAGCENLTIVKLSPNLEKVADYMFYGTGSEYRMNLTVPEGVKEIGVGAFYGCSTITELRLPESVTKIDKSAFYKCKRLETAYMPAVESIGSNAFNHCDSLKDVYYGGTEAQWNAVNVASGNSPLLKATIHCKDSHVCPFDDIADSAHHTNIETAYERGYVSGYGEGIYAPNETVTRAQFITMLWRAAGKPAPTSTDLSFTDISETDYCREAIAWGSEKGIVSGYDANTFGRNDPVTRAQATTFIARYCDKVVGMELNTNDYGFLDINDAREAFRPYINAMANAGLILGYGTTCGPNDKATRGQIASILVRAMDTIG